MAENEQRTYQQDIVGDGISSIQKVKAPHQNNSRQGIKYLLIGICVLFLFVMLVLPLIVVITNALRDGWEAYREAVFDEYTIKALQLTLLASLMAVTINTIFGIFASYLLSKFYFGGRQILAALIDIPFSISQS
ncbi:MAG: hypothetical protein K2G55_13335 [Lachnospiraceae bacterium]|nr:hypothetical protein [Lachnospiraceae bacterium]MDE7204875.1 hypothetical protein [Lachnospiraceae bacterium]